MQIDWFWPVQTLDATLGLSADKAQELSVFQTCARAVVVFAVLILYVRIAKKRFLSSATAFDAILLIIIGSIASRAISGTAPFIASLAGTLTLVVAHWLLSYVSRDWPSLSNLIKGHSTKLIERDGWTTPRDGRLTYRMTTWQKICVRTALKARRR